MWQFLTSTNQCFIVLSIRNNQGRSVKHWLVIFATCIQRSWRASQQPAIFFIIFSSSSICFQRRIRTFWESAEVLQSFDNHPLFDVNAINLEIQSIGYPFSLLPFKLDLFRRLLNFLFTIKQTPGEGRIRVFIGVWTPVGLEETISVIARNYTFNLQSFGPSLVHFCWANLAWDCRRMSFKVTSWAA